MMKNSLFCLCGWDSLLSLMGVHWFHPTRLEHSFDATQNLVMTMLDCYLMTAVK